jgi:lipopolysaccharide/colanic/teichoic acid biosynthesis glycosyltransferase
MKSPDPFDAPIPPRGRRESDAAADRDALEYWSKAATPMGRARIAVRSWGRRIVWHGVVGGSLLVKRTIDLAVASAALLALSPLLGLSALLVKLEDRGPVFFCQRRVGLRGRTFGMWKFRSMRRDAEALKASLTQRNEMAGGVIFKMKNDPRITRVGKWLRKFSIDEMPQLWNVLRGEMSLVGPRPPVPAEVAKYTVEDRQRLLARPGLTCFWQVGGRSEIDFAGQVRLDLAYIRAESVALDLKLLLKTIPAVLLGKGAY